MPRLSDEEVDCDDNTIPFTHEVRTQIDRTEDGYQVDITEYFGARHPGNAKWELVRLKTIMALKPVLEDAVKLAGRLAKNAGIDESGMTQALSQAYVLAVKADRERLANEQIGALFTDGPCQES